MALPGCAPARVRQDERRASAPPRHPSSAMTAASPSDRGPVDRGPSDPGQRGSGGGERRSTEPSTERSTGHAAGRRSDTGRRDISRRAPVGLVVCGGASARFGSDKALARVPGLDGAPTTLLERTLDLLRSRCDRVLVATGAAPRYAALLAQREGVQVVLDTRAEAGPLAGLEAGLAACAEDDDVLVVSCDLPHLDGAALDALLAARREDRGDLVLWRDADRAHPLLGCYGAHLMPALRAALERGERRLIAFHGAPLDGSGPAAGRSSGEPGHRSPAGCVDLPEGPPAGSEQAADGSCAAPRVRVGYVQRDGDPDRGPAANANTRRDLERLLADADRPSPRTP